MAHKKEKSKNTRASNPNYDIAKIIFDYVQDFFPDEDEREADSCAEDAEDEFARAFFVSVTAWNIAALPEDCIAAFLDQAASAFTKNDMVDIWEDTLGDAQIMAADMKTRYSGANHIIIDYDTQHIDDETAELEIAVMPLDEIVAMLREIN